VRISTSAWGRCVAGAVLAWLFAPFLGLAGCLDCAAFDGQWSPTQYRLMSLLCYESVMAVGAAFAAVPNVPLSWPLRGRKGRAAAVRRDLWDDDNDW